MRILRISEGERNRLGNATAKKEFWFDGNHYELKGAGLTVVPDGANNGGDATIEIMENDLSQSV